MGNSTRTPSASPSPSDLADHRQTSKQIHISTNHADGFYFTGERLTGTVKIPVSYLHQHLVNRTSTELIYKRSLRSALLVELVGDAIYSAQVDAAADSDGHATHKVNLCRQRCLVSIHPTKTDGDLRPIVPTVLNGSFQLVIPDGLPPTLSNTRTPSVIYTLELSVSSSRYRYQIPLNLSSRGCLPHPSTDIALSSSALNAHQIRLRLHLSRSFYRPGEQVAVRLHCSNPQKRSIRSIRVTLVQFYRIHHDHHRWQLDGKQWTFDLLTVSSQREWTGEAHLQLPEQPLAASFSSNAVGTTKSIQCELNYCVLVELNAKKGDDIHLQSSSISVTSHK